MDSFILFYLDDAMCGAVLKRDADDAGFYLF
jgi:hypothetical protein